MEFLSELNFKKEQASLVRILYWSFLRPFVKYKLNFYKLFQFFLRNKLVQFGIIQKNHITKKVLCQQSLKINFIILVNILS